MNLLTHAAVRWYGHLRNMEVLDGDSIILARQAARLCAQAGDWKQQYYMPTSADGGVVAFRYALHTSQPTSTGITRGQIFNAWDRQSQSDLPFHKLLQLSYNCPTIQIQIGILEIQMWPLLRCL